MSALVEDLAASGDGLLVLKQDDTLIHFDRRVIADALRFVPDADLRYEHRRAAAEPLLALPDAIAWCWARREDCRGQVESVVARVRRV